jgi:hypothetical protein
VNRARRLLYPYYYSLPAGKVKREENIIYWGVQLVYRVIIDDFGVTRELTSPGESTAKRRDYNRE